MSAVFFTGFGRHERPRVYVCGGYRYAPLHAIARPGKSEILYSWGNLSAPSVALAVDLLSVVLPAPPDDATIDAFHMQIVALLHSPFCITRAMILDWEERFANSRKAPTHY